MSRPRYILTLTPDSDAHPIPVDVRIRHVLKAALRQYGLRCVDVRETTAEAIEWERRGSVAATIATGKAMNRVSAVNVTDLGATDCAGKSHMEKN